MPRRRSSLARGASTIVICSGIATGACSLIVSTDGLTSDSGVDGGAIDAPAASDVSTDAIVSTVDAHEENAIDAAPVAFCASNESALFCDDFDSDAVGSKWDMQQTGGGTIALDATQFRSSPDSALFTANGSASVVNLIKSVAATSGSYRVAFALRVDTAPASSPGSPYQILMRIDNGNDAILELFEDSGSFSVNDRINGSFGTYYSAVGGITVGTWVDVVVHITFGAAGGTSSASIDIDGMNVVPTFDINAAFNGPSSLGLAIGMPYDSGSSTAVNVDNVAIFTE